MSGMFSTPKTQPPPAPAAPKPAPTRSDNEVQGAADDLRRRRRVMGGRAANVLGATDDASGVVTASTQLLGK